MSIVEKHFKLFSNELNAANSTFYTLKSINNIASKDKNILKALNNNALFWNITTHSLQCTFFISLGRIFDTDDKAFSIYKLLKTCIENKDEFMPEALRKRRIGNGPVPEWIDEFMKDIYEPNDLDFQRLRGETSKIHKIYEKKLKPIRDKVFAHTDLRAVDKKYTYFAEYTTDDIKELLEFFYQVEMVIFELFYNGKKCEIGDFKDQNEQYFLKDVKSLLNSIKANIMD